jgi:integrase
LRWPNVDIDSGKMIRVREAFEETKAGGIRRKKPKTRNGIRDISLPDIVVEALRAERDLQRRIVAGVADGVAVDLSLVKLADDALVFPALDGGPHSPRNFSKEWSDTAEAIGMPDITLHALRHTHASQLIEAGIDVVTISKRLGHASPTVTLTVYAHLFRKRDDKSAGVINAALSGFGGQ